MQSLAQRMRNALINVDNTIFSLLPTINSWIDEVENMEVPVIDIALGAENFDIVPTPNTVTAGPIIFIVRNVGAFTHECLIFKTDDTAADIIAAAGVGQVVDESQYNVVADSGDIMAGHYARFDVTLSPGHYVLICNEAGHAHLGMAVDFEVTLLTGSELSDVDHR